MNEQEIEKLAKSLRQRFLGEALTSASHGIAKFILNRELAAKQLAARECVAVIEDWRNLGGPNDCFEEVREKVLHLYDPEPVQRDAIPTDLEQQLNEIRGTIGVLNEEVNQHADAIKRLETKQPEKVEVKPRELTRKERLEIANQTVIEWFNAPGHDSIARFIRDEVSKCKEEEKK